MKRGHPNSYGVGGNSWLHPDIVAMEVLDREWNELVRACVKNSSHQSVTHFGRLRSR